MPHLRLLDLQSPFLPEHEIAEKLAYELPNLEVIGLGDTFWKVDKWMPKIVVSKAMRSRYMLDIANDDELSDERWLMEWRDVGEARIT
jgi:hypothetical protein